MRFQKISENIMDKAIGIRALTSCKTGIKNVTIGTEFINSFSWCCHLYHRDGDPSHIRRYCGKPLHPDSKNFCQEHYIKRIG